MGWNRRESCVQSWLSRFQDLGKTVTRFNYVNSTIDIKGPGWRLLLLPIIYPALYSTRHTVGIKYFVHEWSNKLMNIVKCVLSLVTSTASFGQYLQGSLRSGVAAQVSQVADPHKQWSWAIPIWPCFSALHQTSTMLEPLPWEPVHFITLSVQDQHIQINVGE